MGLIAVDDVDDARLRAYRLLADHRALATAGLFVAEGRLVVARLLVAAARPGRWHGVVESVLLSPAARTQMAATVEAHPDVPVYIAPQAVMNALAGFNIHRGCLALARRPTAVAVDDDVVAGARRVIVLEGVNNPDNVGGIFRAASALGADLVLLGPGCGDPLYRKAVRTSMGAVLDLPWRMALDWPADLTRLRSAGLTVLALTPDPTALSLPGVTPVPPRVALLAGAEGTGLTPDAVAAADRSCTIPMASRGADSLNVTTAVAIALYHVVMGQSA